MPAMEHQITLLVARANHPLLKHGRDFIRRHDGRLLILSGSPWASNDLIYESAAAVRSDSYSKVFTNTKVLTNTSVHVFILWSLHNFGPLVLKNWWT